MKINKSILKTILFLAMFSPSIALAQATSTETELGPVSNVVEYVALIIHDIILPIAGGLALAVIIYAGYRYMTSQGNPDSIKSAKELIVGVVIGIILLFAIEVILNEIGIRTR